MQLKAFTNALDTFLQVDLFKDFCPNGLQIEGRKEVKKVATAVSANIQTLEAAAQEGVDALVVHHGLFWNRDSFPIIGAKKRKLQLLLENQISLLAYHLPLDAHQEVGNNWKAARDLGWGGLESFQEMGVSGHVETQPIERLVKQLEKYYGHEATVALGGKQQVERVALISGGAYRELGAAAAAGVDCYITGNFDEPAWGVAHEEGVHFLALGHSATERVGPQALATYIRETLSVPTTFLDIENPF